MRGVSVIICCYNSINRLPTTLTYISKQKYREDLKWEVIVVDNASTDSTSETAKNLWKDLDVQVPFKIVSQPIPGLSAAREKGIEESSFEYILFCDDDNWLAPNYISLCFDLMENNKNIGVLGGQSVPYFEIEKPSWFDEIQNGYAVGKQAPYSKIVNERQYLWGAGFCIRKTIYKLLRECRFNFLTSDRKGKSLVSGGDSEICYWFLLAGFDLYYSEDLILTHFISKERLTDDYRERLLRGFDFSINLLKPYHDLFYYIKYHKPIGYLGKIKMIKIWFDYLKHLLYREQYYFSYKSLVRLTQFAIGNTIPIDDTAHKLVQSYKCLTVIKW